MNNKREIKFRVWCNTTRHFTDIPFLSCWGKQLIWLHCRNEVSISNLDEGDYVVQQFTGLQDRNGTDVYEGDVIGFKRENPDRFISRRVIEFRYGAFCAIRINKFKFDWEYDYGMPSNMMGPGNPWHICGNIFENPELLQND